MLQAYEFERISAFYAPGRRNIEERLSRALTLRQAREMLFDEDHYGHFPYRKLRETEHEKQVRLKRLLQRTRLGASSEWLFDLVEFFDPVIKSNILYGPKTWNYLKFDARFAQGPEHQATEQRYEQRFASLDWMVLRDLQEGVVEHGYAPSDNPQRMLRRRDGRTYNLGDHVYRVRRTVEPAGVVSHLEIPELKIEGKAKPLYAERLPRWVFGAVPIGMGTGGMLATSLAMTHVPENADPMVYLVLGPLAVGSAVAIATGLKILFYRS